MGWEDPGGKQDHWRWGRQKPRDQDVGWVISMDNEIAKMMPWSSTGDKISQLFKLSINENKW